MRYWFTTYSDEDWTPARGYSERFKREIEFIRKTFHLVKMSPGVEVATGDWLHFKSSQGPIALKINQFTWSDRRRMNEENLPMTRMGSSSTYGVSPLFKFDIQLGKLPPNQSFGGDEDSGIFGRFSHPNTKVEIFLEDVIEMIFPINYPSIPPLMRTSTAKRRLSGGDHSMHDHHAYSNGWMCIMAEPGDWDPRRDTIISALNVGIDWMNVHYKKFGW